MGDLVNKGPDTPGTLDLVRQAGIRCVLGNHDAKLVQIVATPRARWDDKVHRFADRIGPRLHEFAEFLRTWPLWIDLGDLLVVHAGLEPGKTRLEDMSRRCLLTIRTWDGTGEDLDREADPAWYDLVHWPVPVVFGHWAVRGLVDRPDVKGLDTGCVYGGFLTGWCPEEERFLQVRARHEYVPMSKD